MYVSFSVHLCSVEWGAHLQFEYGGHARLLRLYRVLEDS